MAQGNYIKVSGNFTLYADPLIDQLPTQEIRLLCDTLLAPVNITLFAAANQGGFPQPKILVIDSTGNASTNNITIIAGGTDTINGTPTEVITVNGGMARLDMYEIGKWGALFSSAAAGLQPFLTNFIYVDGTNGSDITGLPYRIDLCFATITAAEAVAAPGDVIYVYPGTYTDADLGIDLITYYFCSRAGLNSTGNCFNDATGAISIAVLGDGAFFSSTIAFFFVNASRIKVTGDFADATDEVADISGGAFMHLVFTGDLTSTLGNGIIVSDPGSMVTATFHDMRVGSTGVSAVSANDPTCLLTVTCNKITSTRNILAASPVYIWGGTTVINCNRIIATGVASAGAVAMPAPAGANARLTVHGDMVGPAGSTVVNIVNGLAELHGNVNGGNNNLGGGTVLIAGGGLHKLYGNVISATATPAIALSGGTFYHKGRCVNTAAGAGSGGYLFASTDALILAAGNAIVLADAAATSIDDGGGNLNVQLYGEVVANNAAAATVVPTVSATGLTVDAAVV